MLELRHGKLFQGVRLITANYVWYKGRTRLRLEVIWHLAFGSWPEGHVESSDGTDRPHSLRIVEVPEKFKGRFVK